MAKKRGNLDWQLFSSSPCVKDFLRQKKNQFWALRRITVAIVTYAGVGYVCTLTFARFIQPDLLREEKKVGVKKN